MGATVHRLPAPGARHLVTKQQLCAHLSRSPRWVELRVNEGMPSENLDRYGRRMFDLQAVRAWLDAGQPVATSVAERLEALEAEVASLRATLERLGGGK